MSDMEHVHPLGPDSTEHCARVRDLLPVRADSVDEVRHAIEAHLRGCAACRAEAEFVERIRRTRPEPPPSLAAAILARHAAGARPRRGSGWGAAIGLSAAAGAAALTIGFFATARPATDPMWDLALDPVPTTSTTWYGEEWLIAGGPVPEALSDDHLALLLEELEQ